jgi:nicotinamidase-related amidase
MAEDISYMGSVAPSIAEKFPKNTVIYDKMIFGLASNPEILGAVKETGRKTAILVGIETDDCVAHSALGLLEHGFKVAVVADATGSPGTAHEVGLERMRGAGVLVTSVKSVFYEWLRTVQRAVEFSEKYAQEIGGLKDIVL